MAFKQIDNRLGIDLAKGLGSNTDAQSRIKLEPYLTFGRIKRLFAFSVFSNSGL